MASERRQQFYDCDCGCGEPVTYNTLQSHRAGGGPLSLRIQCAAAEQYDPDAMDVDNVPTLNPELVVDHGFPSFQQEDEQLEPDEPSPGPLSFQLELQQLERNDPEPAPVDLQPEQEMRYSPALSPASPTSLMDTITTEPNLQPAIQHYSKRLAEARSTRWPTPARQNKRFMYPKFIADHPSEDEEEEEEEEETEEAEDEEEEDEEEEDEAEDEDDNNDNNDNNDNDNDNDNDDNDDNDDDGAALRKVIQEDSEIDEQGSSEHGTDGDDDEEEASGDVNDKESFAQEDDLDFIAAMALAARHQAAQDAAVRLHAAQETGLDEDDLTILRPLVLKVEDHITENTFTRLAQTYPNDHHTSLKITKKRARQISGFDAVRYDCCINSCACFVGPYANLDKCPHCKQARLTTRNAPRNHFDYLPLIPRLCAMTSNPAHAELMTYRRDFEPREGIIQDVFAGTHYLELCQTEIPNQAMNHFSDPRDIALGLSMDGFGPHRRRKKTCWPIILLNYNIPPTHRVQKKYIIHIGTIPGPRKPQDWDSFFWPLAQELLALESGVEAFDGLSKTLFTLRAHLLLAFGDIPAVSMMMRMKGQNGVSPCRICLIKGNTGSGCTNYVPLCRKGLDGDDYWASSLPYRTHEEFMDHVDEVENATTNVHREELATKYGIKGRPLLNSLSSVYFPDSFPLDFMHLVWENLVPNLIRFWKKGFKDLDHTNMGYVISTDDWSAIGVASALSGRTIPSVFGAPVPNLATQQYYMTAEMYSNWTLHIAPIVLRGRFPSNIYYKHFMQLVRLLKLCLDLELTEDEVKDLETGFAEWVDEYERLYYQYKPSRLSACPLTIHSLLHITRCIRIAGPVGCYWAYPMERHCNTLLPAVRSRRYPYASISNFVTTTAQLDQIRLMYKADEQLDLNPPKPPVTSKVYPNYRKYRLLRPRRKQFLNASIKTLVWGALVTRYSTTQRPLTNDMFRDEIPLEDMIVQYGKVHIGEGDNVDQVSGCDFVLRREDNRDATFFKYVQTVDKYASLQNVEPVFEERDFFGQLRRILVIQLPEAPHLNIPRARKVIYALVQMAVTEKKDGFYSFKRMGKLELIDLKTMKCVVGRVWDRDQWTVVDRS